MISLSWVLTILAGNTCLFFNVPFVECFLNYSSWLISLLDLHQINASVCDDDWLLCDSLLQIWHWSALGSLRRHQQRLLPRELVAQLDLLEQLLQLGQDGNYSGQVPIISMCCIRCTYTYVHMYIFISFSLLQKNNLRLKETFSLILVRVWDIDILKVCKIT